MKKIILTLVLLFFLLDISQAQYSKNRWRKYRYELYGGLGTAHFFGELGGANSDGTHFVKDINFSETQPVISLGLRYRLFKNLYVKGAFTYAMLSGDDNDTEWKARKFRNLNFKTDVFELGGFVEYAFYSASYPVFRSAPYCRRKIQTVNFYAFTGLVGFYFNPKGLNPNTKSWVALRPLKTEGQGVFDGRKEYSLFQVAIPLGLGFTISLNKYWSIGCELSARHTFTDYIDDVSTTYVPKDVLDKIDKGSAVMSDKRARPNYKGQRGNPDHNDAYIFLSLSLYKKIRTKRR